MLRIVAAFVAIGMLLPTAVAHAASFDCGKATTAYETAICTNPELGALDETLAVAWATAIGGLSRPAIETMRRGQRQWLEYIQRDCTQTGELPRRYDSDQQNCLHSDLYNRIRDLEDSRMRNGWRFYVDQTWSVEPTKSSEAWAKPRTSSYSSPRIDGDDAVARAFNAFVADNDRRIASGLAQESEGEESGDEVDRAVTISVTSASTQRISMRVEESWYGHGAAHPNYAVTYLHYLPKKDRGLTAADVFSGRAWQSTLAALANAALKSQLGEGLWDDVEADVADWASDPSRWEFSDAGLIVQFQPYEVTAYAAGAPTALIPWGELADILSPDASEVTGVYY